MFSEYLQKELNKNPLHTTKTKTTRESYCGIFKQDYPKWEGWKVIKLEKVSGVHVSKIKNSKLDTLVSNFYYIKYIEKNYF